MNGGKLPPVGLTEAGMAELCKAVAAQIEGYAFWYVPGEQSLFVTQELLQLFGLHSKEGFPEILWKSRRLDGRTSRNLQDFFTGITAEQSAGTCAVSIRKGTKRAWYRLQYSWVGPGAIVSVRDITVVRRMRLAYQSCRNNAELEIQGGLLCCVADLREDHILTWIMGRLATVEEDGGQGYTQLLEDLCRRYVDQEDRNHIQWALSRERLAEQEAQGENHLELRVRSDRDSGVSGTIYIRVDLSREPYSGNLCACLFAAVESRTAGCDRGAPNRDLRDGTTGVYTREAFAAQLTRRFADGRTGGGTLVLVRINHLDQVNDVLGSQRGDQVLGDMARTLSVLLHEGDFLGRSGGAEFMLYLEGTPARELLEECLRIICTVLPRKLEQGIDITVNLGAVSVPEGAVQLDDLYAKARLALRSTKEENKLEFYRPELDALKKQNWSSRADPTKSHIFVRTFGYFDVFVDGVPIHFLGGQAKELMALLVDRRGGILSSGEAIACLWENEPANKTTYARFRKVAMRLKQSLEAAGIGDILESKNGERRVIPEKFSCDYYDFLEHGDQAGRPPASGYMTNYSWAESTLGDLEQRNQD